MSNQVTLHIRKAYFNGGELKVVDISEWRENVALQPFSQHIITFEETFTNMKTVLDVMKRHTTPSALIIKMFKKDFLISKAFKNCKNPEYFWSWFISYTNKKVVNFSTEYWIMAELIKANMEDKPAKKAFLFSQLKVTENTIFSKFRAIIDVIWNRIRYFDRIEEMGLIDWSLERERYLLNEKNFLKLIEIRWGFYIRYIRRYKGCHNCSDNIESVFKNKKCACKKVFYCCVECQRDDWINHKLVCSYIPINQYVGREDDAGPCEDCGEEKELAEDRICHRCYHSSVPKGECWCDTN